MDDDEIPPLLPPHQMPPVRSQRDLCQRWRALMGPLGFGQRMLWLNFLESDGSMTPHLTQIAELPWLPHEELLDGLMDICQRILEGTVAGGSVAMLLSRPGKGRITDSDRAWARGLTRTAELNGVPMEPVHLANDERVCVFAPDDLLLPRRSA